MNITNASPRLEALAEKLVAEYADFLGVEEEIFDIEIEIVYNYTLTPTHRFRVGERKALIGLLKLLSLSTKIEANNFAHEMRHHIHSQITRAVMEEDPLRFIRYLDHHYPTNDFDKLSKFTPLVNDCGLDLVEEVSSFDRLDPETLEDNLNGVEVVYDSLMRHERMDLRETFAEDNVSINKLIKLGLLFTSTGSLFNFGGTCYLLMNETYSSAAITGIGMLVTTACAAYLYAKKRDYSFEGEPFTKEVLSRFPKEDRKYLLALPPKRGISLEAQVEILKIYGFPMKYQSFT